MATYQKDRFDSVPDDLLRTGAHRAPARKGHGWISFAWAALATGVLVVAGVVGLSVVNGTLEIDFPFLAGEESATPTPTPTQTAEPLLDPAVPITILNGTPTAGLATQVGDLLVAQGWGGASIETGSRANAAQRDVEDTVVYYSDPANEGAARALVLALQVGEIKLSDVYTASPLTIVLGADYKPAA
ncbi:hypothetical protein BH09ACT3_BH09ACT3_05290 [soil metagenome]